MVIKFNPLNARSVDDAIKKIEEYQKDLDDKLRRFRQLIAERIRWSAESGFSSAITSDIFMGGTPPPNNVTVTVDERDDMTVVIANGEQAVFIEFGAGVYYNKPEPYPNPRPEGIVGIGEYGKGYGSRQAWGYKDEDGELVVTRGNPAAMPMWYASEEMLNAIKSKFLEVFG